LTRTGVENFLCILKKASLTPLAVSPISQNTLPHAADKQINSVYPKLNKSY
jgi:hypothetical protein